MVLKSINLNDLEYVYINLEKDFVKDAKIKKLLSRLNVNKITRVNAFIGKKILGESVPKWDDPGYASACVKSFIAAISAGKTPFVLLEDDVSLLKNDIVSKILSIPPDADVVYLGGSSIGILSPTDLVSSGIKGRYVLDSNYNDFVIPNGMLTAHAILIVTEDAKNKMLEALKENSTIIQDITFARMQMAGDLSFYAISPPIFYQKDYEDMTKDPYQ